MNTPNRYESLREKKFVSCRGANVRANVEYLSSSDVPHTQPDTVGRLHGNELGPFALRAVGDLNHSLACSLLAIDPSDLIPSQIDVGSGTIGRQVSIVDSRDCRVLAKICG